MESSNTNTQVENQLRLIEEFAAAKDWAKVEASGPSTLFSRKFAGNSLDLSKIETVFPFSADVVKKFFSEDFEAHHSLKDNSDFVTVIEVIDANTRVVQNKVKGAFMVSSRDFLGVQSVRTLPNGSFAIVKANIPSHPKQIVSKDTVRGEIVVSTITITALEANKCQAITYFLIDPKGSIPNAVVNSQKTKQLKYLEKVIEHIKKNYKL